MEEALRFFAVYEALIYLILGGLALWEIHKFISAWDEVRGAAFGLERESAQVRLNRAAIALVLLLMVAIAEFMLVSFVVPSVPGAMPLLTPTIDLLATPTITLPPTEPGGAATADSAGTPSPAVLPTLEGTGCIPGQLSISQPQNGELIEGKITLVGTVDLPNFGFYQYEVSRPGDPIWLTIQAGREVRHEEPLGELDTRTLPPGDMLLRLVATDNQGAVQGTCTIAIRVAASQE